MNLTDDILDRFWSKVDKRGVEDCWEWTGAKSNGYGVLGIDGSNVQAHRISWYTANEGAPNLVLHKCDNKACVNPEHLYSGDKSDNAKDACRRLGMNLTLTMDDVIEARRRYNKEDVTYQDLADEYGVTMTTMGKAIRGDTWN